MKYLNQLIYVFLVFIAFSGCKNDPDPIVNIPFDFHLSPNSATAVINEPEEFTGSLTIDSEFEGNSSGIQFYVEAEILDDKSGVVHFNDTEYTGSKIGVTKGDLAIRYTGQELGLHKVVVHVNNKGNTELWDTLSILVNESVTYYDFTITATPNDFTGVSTPPGSKLDFNLVVDSEDELDIMKYKLYYQNLSSNGLGRIFLSESTQFVSGSELPARDINLKLDIPPAHSSGSFQLKLKVLDENLDEREQIISYLVIN